MARSGPENEGITLIDSGVSIIAGGNSGYHRYSSCRFNVPLAFAKLGILLILLSYDNRSGKIWISVAGSKFRQPLQSLEYF